MLLFISSIVMAVISIIFSWKPIHDLHYSYKNNWPKATISGNALLIIILPLLHPWAILGSIFILIGSIFSKQAIADELNKESTAKTTGNPYAHTLKTENPKPTPSTPNGYYSDRRFSSYPKNRSAKGKPPTGSIICFDYTNGKGETSTRTVRVSRCGREYLDGYDMDKSASRTFRLDRIHDNITDTETGEIYHT